jgi:hypothetical protein
VLLDLAEIGRAAAALAPLLLLLQALLTLLVLLLSAGFLAAGFLVLIVLVHRALLGCGLAATMNGLFIEDVAAAAK